MLKFGELVVTNGSVRESCLEVLQVWAECLKRNAFDGYGHDIEILWEGSEGIWKFLEPNIDVTSQAMRYKLCRPRTLDGSYTLGPVRFSGLLGVQLDFLLQMQLVQAPTQYGFLERKSRFFELPHIILGGRVFSIKIDVKESKSDLYFRG